MAVKRRKYTKDYKEAAVALAEREDRSVGQVAREPGINPDMPARWRSELHREQEGKVRAFPGRTEIRGTERWSGWGSG